MSKTRTVQGIAQAQTAAENAIDALIRLTSNQSKEIVVHRDTIAMMQGQLAEANLRILYVMHHFKFIEAGSGDLMDARGQRVNQTERSLYDLYDRDRESFLERIHAEAARLATGQKIFDDQPEPPADAAIDPDPGSRPAPSAAVLAFPGGQPPDRHADTPSER